MIVKTRHISNQFTANNYCAEFSILWEGKDGHFELLDCVDELFKMEVLFYEFNQEEQWEIIQDLVKSGTKNFFKVNTVEINQRHNLGFIKTYRLSALR